MAKTEHYQFPKPDEAKTVADEFTSLQVFMDLLDGILHSLRTDVDDKSTSGHKHKMEDIEELMSTLNKKMSADKKFKLADLEDVSGADQARLGYILVKAAEGWQAQSAASALGDHKHKIDDIRELSDTLAKLLKKTDADETYATIRAMRELTDSVSKLKQDVEQNQLPIGSVIMMASDDKIVPPGCLLMNGAPVTATYPELRAHGIAAGWERNAAGDPLIPDMGGYFARGWRPGQLVDAGRVFGSIQQDALQNITAGYSSYDYSVGNNFYGAFNLEYLAAMTNWSTGSASQRNAKVTFDASRVARTADETRPINRTFTYWVKAYPTKVDTGSIDLANLTRDIQVVAASVSDAESRMQQNINANTIGGVNQTWVNETANRRWGILYQNTTGHTIVLNVLFDPGSSTAPYSTIDIGQTADTPVRIAQGNIGANTVTIIVPNGWYYIARERTAALQRWMELK
ncbi:tail fiber protein [Ochrobactrum sp. MR28]|nr:tail fiber protein [Ochrobactrum sp. MR28]MBX8814740.1 tail fiber protein [Ochrobactrum sp. MR31]